MKRIILLFAISLSMSGCTFFKPKVSGQDMMIIGGKLEAMGMSTFQYGTHILRAGQVTYALKSSHINLKTYEGKDVIIKGLKIAGYPVDGGPEYIDVQEVRNP